mmetsp:Transcript_33141/g.43645  ORF Transcript_33141/g.43645 Transcript_33141/m.43645 type:complete len:81 (+) Transcript_33141:71-313(+)
MENSTSAKNPVNYSFLVSIYALGIVICCVLFCLEKFLDVTAVKGFWVIFAPFFPSLLWGLYMKQQTSKSLSPEQQQKKDS